MTHKILLVWPSTLKQMSRNIISVRDWLAQGANGFAYEEPTQNVSILGETH